MTGSSAWCSNGMHRCVGKKGTARVTFMTLVQAPRRAWLERAQRSDPGGVVAQAIEPPEARTAALGALAQSADR
jgi:hypothetical protein